MSMLAVSKVIINASSPVSDLGIIISTPCIIFTSIFASEHRIRVRAGLTYLSELAAFLRPVTWWQAQLGIVRFPRSEQKNAF